ncbi:MAG: PQQ-binding-like beta-propeller repeat protein [Pseudomonadota bacterium]
MDLRSTSIPNPWKTKASLLIVATMLTGALSGCGYYFGEEEEILPGERISIRRVETPTVEGGQVVLPNPRNVTDWPQAGGNSLRSVDHVGGNLSLTRVWSASAGAGSDSESRVSAEPVAAGGRVFALDAASTVTAFSLSGGSEIWSTDLTPEDEDGRDGFGGGLAVAGEFLIAATGFGEVIGLSVADGSEKWRFKGTSPFRSAPAVSRGLAVVLSRDGQVIGLDVTTGERRWGVIGIEGGAAMLGGGAPAIAGEIVAAPFASGDLAVFRGSDGRRGWSEGLGSARRGAAISLITDVSSAPVLHSGKIYAGSVAGRLVAFEANTGRRVWARDIGLYNRVWATERTLFAVAEDGGVHALSAQTGQTIWSMNLPQYEDPEDRDGLLAYGGPILVGGKIYVVSSDEKLYAINAMTGGVEREVDIPGGSSIPPIFAGGSLIILDENADLHAFN